MFNVAVVFAHVQRKRGFASSNSGRQKGIESEVFVPPTHARYCPQAYTCKTCTNLNVVPRRVVLLPIRVVNPNVAPVHIWLAIARD